MKKILLLSLMITAVFSEDNSEFDAGRPGQTETVNTVPVGLYQIEGGFNSSSETNSGDIMFRTGLHSKVELRMSYSEEEKSIGFLSPLTCKDGSKIDVGFAITLPFSTLESVEDLQIIDLVIPFSTSISENIGLDWHIGVTGPSGLGTASFFENFDLSYATFLGYDLSDNLGLFFGIYGGVNPDIDDMSMDMGLMYQIGDNMQLDINGGIPISSNGEGEFINCGFVIRLPN